MTAHGRSQNDSLLVAALARGSTIETAASEAHISERTARRRMADPAFRMEVTQARSEMLERTSAVLLAASTTAVVALVDLAKGARSEMARCQAAKALLELTLSYRQAGEIEERLTRLEQLALETNGIRALPALPAPRGEETTR